MGHDLFAHSVFSSFFSIVYSVRAAKPEVQLCYLLNKVYTLEQREGQGLF